MNSLFHELKWMLERGSCGDEMRGAFVDDEMLLIFFPAILC